MVIRASLEEALVALERTEGEAAPRAIDRADVSKKGELHLELSLDGERRWYRFSDGCLTRILPADERRLPALAARPELLEGARVLAWRPGRRMVLARDGRVVKLWRRGRSGRAVAAHEAGSRGTAGFRTARLLEHDAELELAAFEYLEGRAPALVDDTDVWFRIGASLAELQRAPTDGLGAHGAADELAVVDRLRERCNGALGRVPEGWRALRATLDERAAELPTVELRPCHRDLHDGQLRVRRGSAPALLDLDGLCLADPSLDLANLLAHLPLRALQRGTEVRPEAYEQAAQALVDGYEPGQDEEFRTRLRFHQASSFLRLALVYALRPRWTRVVAPLVTLASRCLEETRAR